MACMMLRPINLLVLDEPTNHLDIRSKEVLKAAIQAYDGTMIVVSHDRDFLDGMSEKVIEFNNMKLKTYLGDVKYFLEKRAVDNFREVSLGKGNMNIAAESKSNKNTSKEDEKLKKSLKQIEQKIAKTEKSIESCEQVLYDQEQFGTDAYDKAMRDHQALKTELDQLMNQWESIVERI
jgi:ATP-binding cassette subfamily F protein 3